MNPYEAALAAYDGITKLVLDGNLTLDEAEPLLSELSQDIAAAVASGSYDADGVWIPDYGFDPLAG